MYNVLLFVKLRSFTTNLLISIPSKNGIQFITFWIHYWLRLKYVHVMSAFFQNLNVVLGHGFSHSRYYQLLTSGMRECSPIMKSIGPKPLLPNLSRDDVAAKTKTNINFNIFDFYFFSIQYKYSLFCLMVWKVESQFDFLGDRTRKIDGNRR